MKITVDRETCTAAGLCASVAPDLFDQDDDGVVVLLEQPRADQEHVARRAASLCPARAIAAGA